MSYRFLISIIFTLLFQVQVIKYPKMHDLAPLLKSWFPSLVYVCAGIQGTRAGLNTRYLSPLTLIDNADAEEQFTALFSASPLDLVYLDAADGMALARRLHAAGVEHVIAWPSEPTAPPLALPAMHFSHAFFACLRHPTVTVPEAFAIAREMTIAYCSTPGPGAQESTVPPPLPALLSALSVAPRLPDNATVPPYFGPATVGFHGRPLHEIVPTFAAVRACAPQAEVRFLITAANESCFNAQCLSSFCQALRSVLAAETRTLRVLSVSPTTAPLALLPEGAEACRCEALTASGFPVTIVLGGPPDVLRELSMVEHALRQCLTADAHALQLKVPPVGTQLPTVRSSTAVASGASLLEALAVTSTWAVQVLKLMCLDSKYRCLVAAGVGAVGTTSNLAFTAADAKRMMALAAKSNNNSSSHNTARSKDSRVNPRQKSRTSTVVTVGNAPSEMEIDAQTRLHQPPAAPPSVQLGPMVAQLLQERALPVRGAAPLAPQQQVTVTAAETPARIGGLALRPPSSGIQLHPQAIPAIEFGKGLDNPPRQNILIEGAGPAKERWTSARPPLDVCPEDAFLADLSAFHAWMFGSGNLYTDDAEVNGSLLDVFGLYKEVCRRGGYGAAHKINWVNSVFRHMRNWTPEHGIEDVESVLKDYYLKLLLDYEDANHEDVQKDGCVTCAGVHEGECDQLAHSEAVVDKMQE